MTHCIDQNVALLKDTKKILHNDLSPALRSCDREIMCPPGYIYVTHNILIFLIKRQTDQANLTKQIIYLNVNK